MISQSFKHKSYSTGQDLRVGTLKIVIGKSSLYDDFSNLQKEKGKEREERSSSVRFRHRIRVYARVLPS